MSAFKDNFSNVASSYATFRPTYPDALFDWLSGIAPARKLAWDCACGNGQATLPLAKRFDRVIATDASREQIASAPKEIANIEWRVAPAESSGLGNASIDLVTVAQAMHWFDFDRFYAEARRVLRQGGLLAAFSYGVHEIEGAETNSLNQDFYHNTVGSYWPPERRLVEEGYRTIPFPFAEIEAPAFRMEARWTLDQLLGYLSTWSAVSRYKAAKNSDPIVELRAAMEKVWPADELRLIRWPLALRVGRALNPL